jgi:hypothetical protein
MTMRSILARFSLLMRALAACVVLLVVTDEVYARSGGGGGGGGEGQKHQAYVVTNPGKVGPGGNTQGTPPPCKGPACNVRAPIGPINDPTLGGHGHHGGGGGGGGGHGCGGANGCQ